MDIKPGDKIQIVRFGRGPYEVLVNGKVYTDESGRFMEYFTFGGANRAAKKLVAKGKPRAKKILVTYFVKES